MTKIIEKVKNYPVIKSNALIEGKYDFTIWEMRVFAIMVSLVRESDKDFETYRIDIKDIIRLFKCKSNDAYKVIKEVPSSLMDKKVLLPYTDELGRKKRKKFSLLMEIDEFVEPRNVYKEGAYIEIKFHPDLKPHLLDLKGKFTRYQIYNILRLRSTYLVKMYELLKSKENLRNGIFGIELTELISFLGVPKKYTYGNIKQRILTKAQAAFKEHTDISFVYDEITEGRGRRVVSLKFRISKNAPNRLEEPIIPEEMFNKNIKTSEKKNVSKAENEVFSMLKDWGITKKTLNRLLKKHSEEYIIKRIKYVTKKVNVKDKNQETIDNAAGYFMKMMEVENLVDYKEEKQQKEKKQKQKYKEEQKEKEILNEEYGTLKIEYSKARYNVLKQKFASTEGLKENIMQSLKKNQFSGYDKNKTDDENLEKNNMFRGILMGKVQKEYPKIFEGVENKYLPKMNKIEKELGLKSTQRSK